MGKPLAAGVGASGAPAAGDQANAVVAGVIAAVGPTAPFAFRGQFNLALYASINTTLTTAAGSAAATVASAVGLAAGDAINGVNIPPGTTIGVLAGNNVTLAFAPGFTAANVAVGADATAIFTGNAVNYVGSVQLERSFDGGSTWLVCGIGGTGTQAVYNGGGPISVNVSEAERNVGYRLNCTQYTSGVINYRLSQTGAAATSHDVNLS